MSIPRAVIHQTESPSEAKSFTVDGTLANIVKKLAPFWVDPAVLATPDGKRVTSMLLSLVSSVCVFPPESEPVLPRLDQRLLRAFGTLCESEPELYRKYPEVGGVSTTAVLEGKSLLDLCLLARDHDVDISRCDKTEVVRTLVASGTSLSSALVPMTRIATMDRAALMELFTATDGSSWKNKQGWGTTDDIGTWHGVTVEDDGGRVVKLDLSDNNLKGTRHVDF